MLLHLGKDCKNEGKGRGRKKGREGERERGIEKGREGGSNEIVVPSPPLFCFVF